MGRKSAQRMNWTLAIWFIENDLCRTFSMKTWRKSWPEIPSRPPMCPWWPGFTKESILDPLTPPKRRCLATCCKITGGWLVGHQTVKLFEDNWGWNAICLSLLKPRWGRNNIFLFNPKKPKKKVINFFCASPTKIKSNDQDHVKRHLKHTDPLPPVKLFKGNMSKAPFHQWHPSGLNGSSCLDSRGVYEGKRVL